MNPRYASECVPEAPDGATLAKRVPTFPTSSLTSTVNLPGSKGGNLVSLGSDLPHGGEDQTQPPPTNRVQGIAKEEEHGLISLGVSDGRHQAGASSVERTWIREMREAIREEQQHFGEQLKIQQQELAQSCMRHNRGLEQQLASLRALFSNLTPPAIEVSRSRFGLQETKFVEESMGIGRDKQRSVEFEDEGTHGEDVPEHRPTFPTPLLAEGTPPWKGNRPSSSMKHTGNRSPKSARTRIRLPEGAVRRGSSLDTSMARSDRSFDERRSCASSWAGGARVNSEKADLTPRSRGNNNNASSVWNKSDLTLAYTSAEDRDWCEGDTAGQSVSYCISPLRLMSYESGFTLKSDTRSHENEQWKHQWRHQMKARLSKRLSSAEGLGQHPIASLGSCFGGCGGRSTHPRWAFENRSRGEKIVDSSRFQALMCGIIALNAMFIGIEVDLTTKGASTDPVEYPPGWFQTVNQIFCALFALEVALRIAVKGLGTFFCGQDCKWNWFDFVTVLLTTFEEVNDFTSTELELGYTRVLRGFRAIRVLRVIRILRFCRELRLMVCSIAQSLVSFSWGLALLVVIIYLFTICFMHGVNRYLRESSAETDPMTRASLLKFYSSVGATMYTLVLAISGGADWVDMVDPLQRISDVYQALFVFYVLFVLICVLNVLTSVFVQRANELVKLDRDLVTQCQLVSNEMFYNEMKSIFQEVDVDGSGTITWEKFREYLQNEHVQAYFATQQLDTTDARELFNLLDADAKEEVKVEDFVMGCMKLRGQAKSSDVATVLREHKRMSQKTMKAMRKIEKQLFAIGRSLATLPLPESQLSFFQSAFSPSSRWGSPASTTGVAKSPAS